MDKLFCFGLRLYYLAIRSYLVAQSVKIHPLKARDLGSMSEWGRSPGERNGNPLQYSCLENSMDREAWWATAHEVTKNQTRLSD